MWYLHFDQNVNLCLSIIGWGNVVSLALPGRVVSFSPLHLGEWISLSLCAQQDGGRGRRRTMCMCSRACAATSERSHDHMSYQPTPPHREKKKRHGHRHHHRPSAWPKKAIFFSASHIYKFQFIETPLSFKHGIIILRLQSCKFLHVCLGAAFHAFGPSSFSTWLGSSLLLFTGPTEHFRHELSRVAPFANYWGDFVVFQIYLTSTFKFMLEWFEEYIKEKLAGHLYLNSPYLFLGHLWVQWRALGLLEILFSFLDICLSNLIVIGEYIINRLSL